MNNRRIPLAIAVAAALLVPTSSPLAAALGEVATLSALGERFRAEIALEGGAPAEARCFRVVAPDDARTGIPALASGRVSIVGRGPGARLVVVDEHPVSEPVLRLAIENLCESRLRREYTLLMPFSAAAAPATAAAVAPARKPAATRPAAAPARSTPPERATKARAPKAAVRTWSTAAGESLASLGEALYPDDPVARARFSQATAAANPHLFPNPGTHDQPLAAGTRVVIPDLRRAAEKPAEAAEALPLPARAAAPAARAVARAEDRVVVDKAVAAPASSSSPANASPAALGASQAANGLLERERELAVAIDRSIIAEMELLARIKELEELQARLESRLRALAAAPQPAAAGESVAAVAVAASAPAPMPPAPAHSPSQANDVYLFAGLGLAALLLAGLLLRRRHGEQRAADLRAPATPAPHTALNTGMIAEARSGDVVIDTAAERRARGPGANGEATGDPVVVEEHKSAVELADIMISFGRVQGAAETLAEFIRGNPREAVTPWLKLLEVYRAAGLRAEFETIAGELNKTFNVTAVNWDNYQTLRAASTSLEDLPHIAETLQRSWRTTACQRYLQQLLRDNRDGTRVGFPFTVIDEILTLSAILEEELGPCPRPSDAQTRR